MTNKRLNNHLTFYGRKYAHLWNQIDEIKHLAPEIRQAVNMPAWNDSECFVPTAICRDLTARTFSGGMVSVNDEAIVAALAAWRPSQHICQFTPELCRQTIAEAPQIGNLPAVELKQIPDFCLYIETPNQNFGGDRMEGFFVFADDLMGKSPFKRLVFVIDTPTAPEMGLMYLALQEKTIGELLEDEHRPNFGNDKNFSALITYLEKPAQVMISLTLTALRQLNGSESFAARPQLNYASKRKRYLPAAKPQIWKIT